MHRHNDALTGCRAEIARLDRLSRDRSLTTAESNRLGQLIYRERYLVHERSKQAA